MSNEHQLKKSIWSFSHPNLSHGPNWTHPSIISTVVHEKWISSLHFPLRTSDLQSGLISFIKKLIKVGRIDGVAYGLDRCSGRPGAVVYKVDLALEINRRSLMYILHIIAAIAVFRGQSSRCFHLQLRHSVGFKSLKIGMQPDIHLVSRKWFTLHK